MQLEKQQQHIDQTHLHHRSADCQPKLLHVWVVVEVSFPDQVVDLPLPVWCRPGCGLDHCGGLHVSKFLDAPLPRYNVAHLQGKVRVLVFLTNLQMSTIYQYPYTAKVL